jgi:hypothetical protein
VFTAWYVLPTKCIYLFYCGSENIERLLHCAALSVCYCNRAAVGFSALYVVPTQCMYYKRGDVFTARYVLPKQCYYDPLVHCTTLSDWFL